MSNMTWLALALIASSLSLAVALIRLWRRKINAPNPVLPVNAESASSPHFNQSWAGGHWPVELGFVTPPQVEATEIVWSHQVQGESTLWLSRQGDEAWWVTWHAPWRRGLADELECTTKATSVYNTSLPLSAGLWTHWQGAPTDAPPTLASDAELWRIAQLFGVHPILIRGQECVALRIGFNEIRSAFDLSCLAALAALIDNRARDDVLPKPGLCGPVALRVDAVTYGDIPPFGTIENGGEGLGCRFVALGSRSSEGIIDDRWLHRWTLGTQQSPTHPLRTKTDDDLDCATMKVSLSDGRVAEMWALDGKTERLQQALVECNVELFNTN